MIVDKKNKKVISDNKTNTVASKEPPKEQIEKPLQIAPNGPMDVLKAMKEILRGSGVVPWNGG